MLDEPCPICGKPLVERRGRFGVFKSCSDYPKCPGPKGVKKPAVASDFGALGILREPVRPNGARCVRRAANRVSTPGAIPLSLATRA